MPPDIIMFWLNMIKKMGYVRSIKTEVKNYYTMLDRAPLVDLQLLANYSMEVPTICLECGKPRRGTTGQSKFLDYTLEIDQEGIEWVTVQLGIWVDYWEKGWLGEDIEYCPHINTVTAV